MLPGDDFARRQLDLFTHLIEAVGDADVLWCLDTTPLPDEPFDWSAVEPGDVAFVEEVLGAERPLLHRSARHRVPDGDASHPGVAPRADDPRPFRRSPHLARCGASLVWLAGQANGEFGRGSRRSPAWLWTWFGVGSCSDRGRSLRRAAGLEPEPGSWSAPLPLGDPALLHSRFRALLVAQRDRMLEVAGRRRTWSVLGSDEATARIGVRAAPTKVVHAVKGVLTDTGRATVIIGFGERLEDADFVALSVPGVHELARQGAARARHLVADLSSSWSDRAPSLGPHELPFLPQSDCDRVAGGEDGRG